MLPFDLAIFVIGCLVLLCGTTIALVRASRMKVIPLTAKGSLRRKQQSRQVETLEVREVFDAAGVELEGENVFIDGQFYSNVDMVALAKAITATGAKFYGAVWCPHCTEQKSIFGDGGSYLPFVEVTNPDKSLNDLGNSLGITKLPTWVFADGTRVEGTLSLTQLVQYSGVTVPTSTTPYIAEIDPITLTGGDPLFLTLDGYSPTGQPLTYTVTSSSGTVETEVRQQTRSLRLTIKNFGVMEFQLLEDYNSLATQQIISLVQQGFYDGLTFHRIIQDFMIQGGDPTGTGYGDPSLPTFNDQYNNDLLYNRAGTLGMAKTYDDTNSSQFFITSDGDNGTDLDFRYTIFGYMTEGDAVRAAIAQIPTTSADAPTYDVIIEKAEIFYDTENALVKLNTFIPGITGADTLTITATDVSGHTFTRNVSVSYTPSSPNKVPYLGPVPNTMVVNPGSTKTYPLTGTDPDGDTIWYLDKSVLDANSITYKPLTLNSGITYSVDYQTGLLTIQASSSFRGTGQIIVAAYDQHFSAVPGNIDFQVITISASATPVLANDTFDTIAGSVNTLTPLANDTAQAPAWDYDTFEITDAPAGMQLSVENGNIVYSPPLGFSGTFSLHYQVSNIYGGAATNGLMTINVVPNTTAVAGDDLYQIDAGSVAILDVLGNDRANKYLSTNAGLSITAFTSSAAGAAISIEDGKIRYVPAQGFTGLDTFTYTISNGTSTATASVTVSVLEIEDIGLTVTREKSDASVVDALPLSESYLNEWDAFWVEVWANGDRISTQGISAAALDLQFVPGLFEATTIESGSDFQFTGTPTINSETGEISGLDAVATSTGLGVGDRVLLARIRFQPVPNGGLAVDSEGIAFDAFFSVSDAQIQAPDTAMVDAQITALPSTKILPVVYDLDDDGQINLSDIFTFANLYTGSATTTSPVGDFDLSGALTTYDASLMLREIGDSWVSVSHGAKINYDFSYLAARLSETPLTAEGAAASGAVTTIDAQSVQPVFDAATAMIEDAYSQLGIFNYVVTTNFQIVDLPGSQLSYRNNGTIYLDIDAAGLGWFVDQTPTLNEEFTSSGTNAWQAIVDGDADGGIDLLSVILHELIGNGDETQNELFADSLASGTRYLFAPEDLPVYQLLVDQAMAQA